MQWGWGKGTRGAPESSPGRTGHSGLTRLQAKVNVKLKAPKTTQTPGCLSEREVQRVWKEVAYTPQGEPHLRGTLSGARDVQMLPPPILTVSPSNFLTGWMEPGSPPAPRGFPVLTGVDTDAEHSHLQQERE